MPEETRYSRTNPSHITFAKQPPSNPNDIRVSEIAIDVIVEDAALNDTDREIVTRWLPVLLLDYFLPVTVIADLSAKGTLDTRLRQLESYLGKAHGILESEDGIVRALIGRERRRLSASLETQHPSEYEIFLERCSAAATQEIEAQIERIGHLLEEVSRLRSDPLLSAASVDGARPKNSSNLPILYLGRQIRNCWQHQLRRSPEISHSSPYVQFAQAIYGLVGQDTSAYQTLRSRLQKVESEVESKST